jgi:hypothetical protein
MRRARIRLLLLCLGTLALVLPSLRVHPAAAAGGSAMCSHQWNDSIDPGVTTTRKHAVVSSHGETGTIQCSGTVRGQQVTGPGTFGEEGVVDGDCSSGTGQVLFSFTLPTAGGPMRLRFPVSFSFGPGAGQTSSDVFPGAFLVRPVTGDCVTTPITEIAVSRVGLLQS